MKIKQLYGNYKGCFVQVTRNNLDYYNLEMKKIPDT